MFVTGLKNYPDIILHFEFTSLNYLSYFVFELYNNNI